MLWIARYSGEIVARAVDQGGRGIRKVIVILTLVGVAVLAAVALATPASPPPVITVETARGSFAENLKVNTELANGARVKLKTKGAVELITQRIVAQPGATFGWHTHPGENVNVILQGTLTLYHDEACTVGTEYPAGSAFPTHPNEIHLARNLGTTDIIFFATYFAPKTDPATPVRIDAPLPAAGCPQ